MKIAVVLGTRPEIIKMSPIIKECIAQDLDYHVIHTGQHYSYSLDGIFFSELGLPQPNQNLDIGHRASHGSQTGIMMYKLDISLEKDKPDIVLVEGDTNTSLAGAITASKLHIKVGHIEAGLRSYNRYMQEEINRVLADHCSDLLFAPTESARQHLLSEGINNNKIFVTGNTIVDALQSFVTKVNGGVPYAKPYALATIHRAENVDDRERFLSIVQCLEEVGHLMTVVYPIHPRAKCRAEEFHINLDSIKIIEPVGYLEFLNLERNAKVVLTDSGGVQEEACILRVPCVTLRDETERQETVEIGANIVAGIKPDNVVRCVETMINKTHSWANPFGNGQTAKRIVEIIRRHCG